MTRERLLGLLWPESNMVNARHSLNQAVHIIRKSLGEHVLISEGDILRLDLNALRVDVLEFEAVVRNGDPDAAVALYAGPFLDGLVLPDSVEFEQWAERERDRLERSYRDALEQLATTATTQGRLSDAVRWWRRCLAYSPADASIVTRLMRVLSDSGDRAAALEAATAHARLLREEFDAMPDPAVERMARQLRRAPVPIPHPMAGGGARMPADPLAEQLAPELELIRLVGEGDVARVYLARDPALVRMVAVKVLHPELAADEVARLRFEREAQAAAGISHPNVIVIHRIARLANAVPYIVMEYIEGRTLADVLEARGALPFHEVHNIVALLAGALAAAHRRGVVHRDLKPRNVMQEAETDRIVLMDFGLAALLDTETRSIRRLTAPGERVGDPNYMSPEQARQEPPTQQSDIYSLGVVTYELLTGAAPFQRHSNLERMQAQLEEEPPALEEVHPDINRSFAELIRRCLAKKPEHRPRAAEVVAALGSR